MERGYDVVRCGERRSMWGTKLLDVEIGGCDLTPATLWRVGAHLRAGNGAIPIRCIVTGT